MKAIAKSLVLAFVGTGLLFFFLMMVVIPTQALLARLGGNIAKTSVVINPGIFLRTIGIPAAGMTFVILFAVALHRIHRGNHEMPMPVRH